MIPAPVNRVGEGEKPQTTCMSLTRVLATGLPRKKKVMGVTEKMTT